LWRLGFLTAKEPVEEIKYDKANKIHEDHYS
jgi:hypothetical protein